MVGVYMFLFGSFFGAVLTGPPQRRHRPAGRHHDRRPALHAHRRRPHRLRRPLHPPRHLAGPSRSCSRSRTRPQRVRASPTPSVPVIQVRNLDFSYGQVQVLFDIDLDVRDGEMLALLGTNGAGKSTLLRVISGLGVAERGVVRLQRPDRHLRRARAAGPDRHRAADRRRRHVPAADGATRTCAWRRSSFAPHELAGAHRAGARAVPDAARPAGHAGRGPVGRPAADARPRHGAGARARGAHHRRAVARSRAGGRPAGARRRAHASRSGA